MAWKKILLFACVISVLAIPSLVADEKYDETKFDSYQEYLRSKTPLRHRLDKLIIPKCKFEDVELRAVLEFLRDQSRKLAGDNVGFNLFFRCKKEALDQKISLDLENVPVSSLLRFVCLAATGMPVNFMIEKHAVVIVDRGPREKINIY